MLNSLIQSSKETDRWVEQQFSRNVGGLKNDISPYRIAPSPASRRSTTRFDSHSIQTGKNGSKIASNRNAQHWASSSSGSKKSRKGRGLRINHNRSNRRSRPYRYHNHKGRHKENRNGPTSPTYNPTIPSPHGSYNRDTGRSDDVLCSYSPVPSSRSPAQYKQFSPMYATAPQWSPTSPAYSSTSPVCAVDSPRFYQNNVPSPAVPGGMAGHTKRDGCAMTYSPTSPTYAFISTPYKNPYIGGVVTPPKNAKGSTIYSPVFHKTIASPLVDKTSSCEVVHEIKENEVSPMVQLKQTFVDTVLNEINSPQNDSYFQSNTNTTKKQNHEDRLEYDPTQPQYSPTYNPAAMTDGWADEEANGRLLYDPENPEYF